MRTSTILRIASVITLLLFAGHTAGSPWTPDHGAASMTLVGQLKSHHFDVMGFSRSHWDFYQGFGLSISVYLLVIAVLLWQLAGMAREEAERTRPFIAVLLAGFVALGILDWFYFFTAPLVLTVAIALCLGWALVGAHADTRTR